MGVINGWVEMLAAAGASDAPPHAATASTRAASAPAARIKVADLQGW
jgi:hypothetical protein